MLPPAFPPSPVDEHKPWLSTKPSLVQELTFSLAGFISSVLSCASSPWKCARTSGECSEEPCAGKGSQPPTPQILTLSVHSEPKNWCWKGLYTHSPNPENAAPKCQELLSVLMLKSGYWMQEGFEHLHVEFTTQRTTCRISLLSKTPLPPHLRDKCLQPCQGSEKV